VVAQLNPANERLSLIVPLLTLGLNSLVAVWSFGRVMAAERSKLSPTELL
jgi:hypothetical protein